MRHRGSARIAGQVILFIDEMHTVVGAAKREALPDAAAAPQAGLARGELRVVGRPTLDEYRKHVRKTRPGTPLQPGSIGRAETGGKHQILRGLSPLRSPQALRSRDRRPRRGAKLSAPLHHRCASPDKAIDLGSMKPASKLAMEPKACRPRSTRSTPLDAA